MESNSEKVSYCIGLEAGRNIKGQFKDIDDELLKKGFSDALANKTPSLEREEMETILKSLQQQIQMQQKQYVEELAMKNKEDGESFLEENKENEGVSTLASGLQYKILNAGTGVSPSMHDEVTIHYRGSLIDGTVFDSTYERDEPQKVPLSRLIPGWSEALKMMKVGDKWQLSIPSYLAYGENGFGPHIQPNATLLFDVELIKIN